jgi:hypothetical protein
MDHYRSVLRGFYKTALLPGYRATSGITVNPFRDVPRESVVERTVTIPVDDLRSWLANASYHVRLAVAIAARSGTGQSYKVPKCEKRSRMCNSPSTTGSVGLVAWFQPRMTVGRSA